MNWKIRVTRLPEICCNFNNSYILLLKHYQVNLFNKVYKIFHRELLPTSLCFMNSLVILSVSQEVYSNSNNFWFIFTLSHPFIYICLKFITDKYNPPSDVLCLNIFPNPYITHIVKPQYIFCSTVIKVTIYLTATNMGIKMEFLLYRQS